MKEGPTEFRFPKFHVYNGQLEKKDYKSVLDNYTKGLCNTALGGKADLKVCIQEVKPAVDCVVRAKTQKLGFLQDNIRVCSAEIELMKRKMTKKYNSTVLEQNSVFDKVDAALLEIQNQLKSFV